MSLDELVHRQLVASAELAIAAVTAGLADTAMLYIPGDAPCVTRMALRDHWEICTDGGGTFDIWQVTTKRPIKIGLSLTDAVAFLSGSSRA